MNLLMTGKDPMRELGSDNAARYLMERGLLAGPVPVEELAYGVSNLVLLVRAEPPFVLKQSRPQLRTKDPWFSSPERVFREADAMRALRELLGPVVPEVLFEDRENFLFCMSAAPPESRVWKELLLAGQADRDLSRLAARVLARMHGGASSSAATADWAARFGDQRFFHELRLEPYYLRLPSRVPDLRRQIDDLVAETSAIRTALVHADFSPKNLLVRPGLEPRMVLVDYETVHWGDPAFDLGFFLAHLSLKTIHHHGRHEPFVQLVLEFWEEYLAQVEPWSAAPLVARALRHLAACMLVRIDGTSPVDYLDEGGRRIGRAYARSLFAEAPSDWQAALDRLDRHARANR